MRRPTPPRHCSRKRRGSGGERARPHAGRGLFCRGYEYWRIDRTTRPRSGLARDDRAQVRVLRLEADGVARVVERLHGRLVSQKRHHDVAVIGRLLGAHHHQVVVEDAGVDHGVTLDAQHEAVGVAGDKDSRAGSSPRCSRRQYGVPAATRPTSGTGDGAAARHRRLPATLMLRYLYGSRLMKPLASKPGSGASARSRRSAGPSPCRSRARWAPDRRASAPCERPQESPVAFVKV